MADDVWERVGWDEYWLGVASAVSVRADCRRRRVGAVVVSGRDGSGRVYGSGYNGTAIRGVDGCLKGKCPRGLKTFDEVPPYFAAPDKRVVGCIATHAEMNAVEDAEGKMGRLDEWEDFSIYVTDMPCADCSEKLIELGIRVVWPL